MHHQRSWLLCSTLVLGFLISVKPAAARRAGITETSCTACHGSSPAQLDLVFDPVSPAPGEPMSITATVSSSNMQAAGIAVNMPEGGQYSIPAGEPLTVSGGYVIHTQPKPASNGEVVFQLVWTPPEQAGSGRFNVAVLAINDDKRQSGDATAVESGQIGFGCEAITLYRDTDGDGVGVTSQFLTDCEGLPGFAVLEGDCDDDDPSRYPGAPELCNQVDDDCDDEIDEDVVDQTYYLDEDGDGYGHAEESIEACIPMQGYVDNPDDCHYLDPTINPDAEEICDFVDNDCDGEIDEGAEFYCGVGECRRKSELCAVLCTPGEPTEEVCNGLDDDCDGEIDEEFCPNGQVCQDGSCVPVDELPAQSGEDLQAASEMLSNGDDAPSANDPQEPGTDDPASETEPDPGGAADRPDAEDGTDNPRPGAAPDSDSDAEGATADATAANLDTSDSGLDDPESNDETTSAASNRATSEASSTGNGGCALSTARGSDSWPPWLLMAAAVGGWRRRTRKGSGRAFVPR